MENNNEEYVEIQETQTTENKILNQKTIVLIITLVIVTILAFLLETIIRSPKSTVKEYIKALEKMDMDKMIELMDPDGAIAFYECSYDFSKFDSLYEKNLKITTDEEKKDIKNNSKEMLSSINPILNLYKSMKIKCSLKNVKVQKVKNSKKLTRIDCTVIAKVDNITQETEVTFYTVKKGLKNYIVSMVQK